MSAGARGLEGYLVGHIPAAAPVCDHAGEFPDICGPELHTLGEGHAEQPHALSGRCAFVYAQLEAVCLEHGHVFLYYHLFRCCGLGGHDGRWTMDDGGEGWTSVFVLT